MEKSNLLMMIIELIVLLIPIGGLIWKAAKQSGKIETMDAELNKLKTRVETSDQEHTKDIQELKNSFNNLDKKIDVNNAQILSELRYITQTINELKAKDK